jgi:hypothetical protein
MAATHSALLSGEERCNCIHGDVPGGSARVTGQVRRHHENSTTSNRKHPGIGARRRGGTRLIASRMRSKLRPRFSILQQNQNEDRHLPHFGMGLQLKSIRQQGLHHSIIGRIWSLETLLCPVFASMSYRFECAQSGNWEFTGED